MEKKEIEELLGNTTDFNTELSSSSDEEKNPDGKTVKKYFNIKLKKLLDANEAYSNIKITFSDFIEELHVYIFSKIFNNDQLDKKVAKKILKEIREYFAGETQIEIDSFYPSISGEKIQLLFKLIEDYSYPKLIEIDPKVKYTVIVESTYCLEKNVIKKAEQLRKNFLFFSVINKYYKKYKEYLEEFYEYFIKKYIFSKKVIGTIYEYQKDNNFDLSGFSNYIILMASNSTLKLFKDASDSIYKATPYEASEIDYNIEKCFQFPILKPKIKLDEKKSFKGKEGNNGTDNVTTKNTELFDSYRRFKYLFEKINLENDFKAKSIYLDLYLKVVTPKKQIKDKLDELIKAIKENNNSLSKENESMRTELNNTKIQLVNTQNALANTQNELTNTKNELTNTRSELANTKNELLKTNQNVEKLMRYIQQKDPKFKIENI